jgi:large subunit ribosomal protein L29
MPRPMEKLRDLGPQELVARERELTDQVFRLRFQMNTGQSEGLKKLRLARRDLARVKTLLREGELNRPAVISGAKTGAETGAKTVVPPKARPAKAKSNDAKPRGEKLKGAAPKSTKPSTKPNTKPRTSHGK